MIRFTARNVLYLLAGYILLVIVLGVVLSRTVNTWFGLITYIGIALIWPVGSLLLRRVDRQPPESEKYEE